MNRTSPWPDDLETVLLAKSADKSVGNKPESLAEHTWTVLSRLADFIKLRPRLPEQLAQPRLWHCLYWGAFLHDFGKALPGFQGVLRGNRDLKEQWGGHRHEVFSLAFLDWLVEGLNAEERVWTAAAIVSHHRDKEILLSLYSLVTDLDGRDPLLKQLEPLPGDHLQGLHRWLVTCGWAWAQALHLDELGVGPVSLVAAPEQPFPDTAVSRIRYWLEEYEDFVEGLGRRKYADLVIPLMALRGTLINADHSASAHAPSLPQVTFTAEQVLTSRNIAREKLFTHQTDSERKTGSTLLIAPTGSGKTEAALLWAANQAQNDHQPPRLFYTLPFQASMNAMQKTVAGNV